MAPRAELDILQVWLSADPGDIPWLMDKSKTEGKQQVLQSGLGFPPEHSVSQKFRTT